MWKSKLALGSFCLLSTSVIYPIILNNNLPSTSVSKNSLTDTPSFPSSGHELIDELNHVSNVTSLKEKITTDYIYADDSQYFSVDNKGTLTSIKQQKVITAPYTLVIPSTIKEIETGVFSTLSRKAEQTGTFLSLACNIIFQDRTTPLIDDGNNFSHVGTPGDEASADMDFGFDTYYKPKIWNGEWGSIYFGSGGFLLGNNSFSVRYTSDGADLTQNTYDLSNVCLNKNSHVSINPETLPQSTSSYFVVSLFSVLWFNTVTGAKTTEACRLSIAEHIIFSDNSSLIVNNPKNDSLTANNCLVCVFSAAVFLSNNEPIPTEPDEITPVLQKTVSVLDLHTCKIYFGENSVFSVKNENYTDTIAFCSYSELPRFEEPTVVDDETGVVQVIGEIGFGNNAKYTVDSISNWVYSFSNVNGRTFDGYAGSGDNITPIYGEPSFNYDQKYGSEDGTHDGIVNIGAEWCDFAGGVKFNVKNGAFGTLYFKQLYFIASEEKNIEQDLWFYQNPFPMSCDTTTGENLTTVFSYSYTHDELEYLYDEESMSNYFVFQNVSIIYGDEHSDHQANDFTDDLGFCFYINGYNVTSGDRDFNFSTDSIKLYVYYNNYYCIPELKTLVFEQKGSKNVLDKNISVVHNSDYSYSLKTNRRISSFKPINLCVYVGDEQVKYNNTEYAQYFDFSVIGGKNKVNTLAIVLSVIGSIVLISAAGVAVIYIIRKRKGNEEGGRKWYEIFKK